MKKISWDSMAEFLTDEERQHRRMIQEARSVAISYLGLSKKSSGKTAQKLRDEGYDESTIRDVIRELTEEGYLDDLKIARRMIRQRQGRLAESQFSLKNRMIQAGLSREAIEKALSEAKPDQQLARDLIEIRFSFELDQLHDPATPPQEKRRLMQKMGRFLGSRGFDGELIARLLSFSDS